MSKSKCKGEMANFKIESLRKSLILENVMLNLFQHLGL